MYLSRLMLNPRQRTVQREIANPYELHRTLMGGFAKALPASERVLHRVDTDPRTGIPTILVQSHTRPTWSHLVERAQYLLPSGQWPPQVFANPAVKPFALTFAPGQRLAFRLRANPTVKHSERGQRQGRRDPLYKEEEQRAWLDRKADTGGFAIVRVNIIQEGNAYAWKPRQGDKQRKLTHFAVRFDGVLTVTDPEALWETVQRGIGPAKSFGFGLLSLAPVR
jgi:CRISPR system Cascade subunit CasE